MILPTKRLSPDRSMLALGGEILRLLYEPKTVSRLWEEFCQMRDRLSGRRNVTFSWFVLALDFLYAVRAIETERGRIQRTPL
jgi:hypothetical protein